METSHFFYALLVLLIVGLALLYLIFREIRQLKIKADKFTTSEVVNSTKKDIPKMTGGVSNDQKPTQPNTSDLLNQNNLHSNTPNAVMSLFSQHGEIFTESVKPCNVTKKQSVQVLSDTESNMDKELEFELALLNTQNTTKTQNLENIPTPPSSLNEPPKSLIDFGMSYDEQLKNNIDDNSSSKDGSSENGSFKNGSSKDSSSSESIKSGVSLLSADELKNIKKTKRRK